MSNKKKWPAKGAYVITGTLPNGHRFQAIPCSNLLYALSHNVWRGTLWLAQAGKRSRVKTWYN